MNRAKLKQLTILTLLFAVFSVSVLAQADAPRETKAITYPLDEKIKVAFRGTTRFPRMKGEAEVRRTKKNGTEIKLDVKRMPRAFELGKGYATYVLWAISPSGQIDNLGEIKRRGFWEFNSSIDVTTPLQTFALLVTAEPHFLVSRPSQQVMLENLKPYSKKGKSISTVSAIQYFGNSSDYFRDPSTPLIAEVNYKDTPPSILQAKQALALAKYAGAERDALDDYQKALTYLRNAENGWAAGRSEEYIDVAAREAIRTAVMAENGAIAGRLARKKLDERMRQDAELRDAEEKVEEAKAEIARLNLALTDETRTRELTERDKMNYLEQISELKSENKNLRDQLQEVKIKLAKIEAQEQALIQAKVKKERTEAMAKNRPQLLSSLRKFGTVKDTDSGIVLMMKENMWAGTRVSGFTNNGTEKLDGIATLLASHPDYRVIVESHLDNDGTAAELDLITTERAQAVSDFLMNKGISEADIESKGYGATIPVAENNSRTNRAKNRRVYIILVPKV